MVSTQQVDTKGEAPGPCSSLINCSYLSDLEGREIKTEHVHPLTRNKFIYF